MYQEHPRRKNHASIFRSLQQRKTRPIEENDFARPFSNPVRSGCQVEYAELGRRAIEREGKLREANRAARIGGSNGHVDIAVGERLLRGRIEEQRSVGGQTKRYNLAAIGARLNADN